MPEADKRNSAGVRSVILTCRQWAGLVVLFILLLAGISQAQASVPSIRLDDGQHQWQFSAQAQYMKDERGDITIEALRRGEFDRDFFTIETQQANFGFHDAVYWIRFNLTYRPRSDRGNKNFWLSFEYPLLDYVDLYLVDESGQMTHFSGGDQRPFSQNPVDFPRPSFELNLTPKAVTSVFIRVENKSSQQLGFGVWDTEGFSSHISWIRLQDGIFVGIMLIMMLYNLFVFIAIKDSAYLYYVMAITSFLLGQCMLTGLTWQYVHWKDLVWNNNLTSVFLNITWMFLLLFSRAFLQTKKIAPMMDGLLKFLALASAWMAVLSFISDYNFTIKLSTRLTLIYALVSTLIGLALWRRGHRAARYYTFAWVAYMGSVLLALLYLFGVIPYSYIAANGIHLGAFANVLLLSLALADRINTQKRETELQRRRALMAREDAIEANQRALSHLKMFRKLYENASEGIFQCSFDGKFISANPSLAGVFGYDSADELIADVEDIADQCYHSPDVRKEFEAEVLDQGRIINHEALYVKRDGRLFWGSSSAHLVRDDAGRPAYIEGSLIDITERKDKEKAQREREAAQASASAKSEFLANMSHEIRTPMNAIIGFAALAQKTDLDTKQRDYVSKIEHSSKALLGIINDILDFSKIEAGKLSLESVSFNLYDVINDIVNILSQKSAEKNLELVVRVSPSVMANLMGDPLRLEQILINLTNNAIKFTAEGEVIIRIKEIQSLDQRVQLLFEVIDTGIGITKAQQERLFTPFTQADGSTTRKYGGTGLGLSISKQLVELMSGEIWVESVEGEGSTFAFSAWFDLQPTPEQKSIYAAKELKDLRVLLIDDKDAGQEAILEILDSFRCQATLLQPDYTLISKLESEFTSEAFDLVIVDRQLKAIETMEAARKIRQLAHFSETPIVIMALTNEEHFHETAAELGFHCLIKPVTPSVMLDCIQSILGYTGPKQSKRMAGEEQERLLQRLNHHQVLLVEDTPFNQEIATEFLAQVGVSVTLAENGQKALELLDQMTQQGDWPDAVLMDVQMPVMDGFEATRRIRSQPKYNALPIIAMTANAMKGDKNRCLQAGMDDYISKPISQAVLYQTLLRWLIRDDAADAGNESLYDDSGTSDVTRQTDSPEFSKEVEVTPSETQAPVLDLQSALTQMGGSEALLNKMLQRFVNEQSNALENIIETYDSGDVTTAHRLAHTLKGIAGSLSATGLQKAAAELETALESGAVPTQIEKLFFNAETALQAVLEFIGKRTGA
ncbi:MAG: response regulator [Hahellaceae bacterium]|nr:response regulator [Hahellaceae bacterium]